MTINKMFNTMKYIFGFLLIISTLTNIHAQKFKQVAMQARDFYYQNFNELKTPENVFQWDNGINYAVNFKEGGYLLVQNIHNQMVVTAVIPDNRFSLDNNRLFNDKTNIKIEDVKDLPPVTPIVTRRDTGEDVDNFLPDEWGSVNCIDDQNNIVNVTNYYTPGNCSAGCVAISTSQILHFYEWPRIGVGNNTYSDNYNGSLVRHGAFFDKAPYDWQNMLDQYMYVHSTDAQREAVGRLVYDVAVALEMNFEPSGSTSNVNKVPFILENYFRYSGHYEDRSWSQFWSRLYDNIHDTIPVSVPVENSAGDGHAFVISGFKRMNGDPYYYINWGWYNQGTPNNGWYNIQAWNNNTPGYNHILGGLFDVVPEPEITSITPTGNGNDFTIHWETAHNVNYEEFTLQRKRNHGNWVTVATGITDNEYTYQNPTGEVYRFRVKGKAHGVYYNASYSEQIPYAPQGSFKGFGSFEGQQYAYAKQTANYDLIFNHDYTFETWIRLQPGNQNADVIFDRQYIFAFEIEDVTANDYSVVFKSPAAQDALHSNANGGAKLQIGEWYHIAVSNEGTTARLFVNGEQRDINIDNHFHLNSSNAAINIGERYHGSYSGFIKADFDQIRWSDIARYTTNFTPQRDVDFSVDDHTKAYFRFENIHRNRLKDEAFRTSVRVKNQVGFVQWDYDYDSSGVSVKDIDFIEKNLSVYPNPVTDILHLKVLKGSLDLSSYTIQLFSLAGKKIAISPEINQNGLYRLDVSKLPKGIYLLSLKKPGFEAHTQILKK